MAPRTRQLVLCNRCASSILSWCKRKSYLPAATICYQASTFLLVQCKSNSIRERQPAEHSPRYTRCDNDLYNCISSSLQDIQLLRHLEASAAK